MLSLVLVAIATFAGSTVPPPDPVTAFQEWASARGTPVVAPACNVPDEGFITCYGINQSSVVVGIADAADVDGALVFSEGIVSTTPPSPTMATIANADVLNRDAELAVRACVDEIQPPTFVITDLVNFGDDTSLETAQDLCNVAYAQLEVENSAVASALNLCVSEINLSMAGIALTWSLTHTVDEAKADSLEAVFEAAWVAMTTLLAAGTGTCNDDIEPTI